MKTQSEKRLTEKQAAKLAKAAGRLPEGWTYEVTDDKNHILVQSNDGIVACAGRSGRTLYGWTDENRVFINRACAAVWGRQVYWR